MESTNYYYCSEINKRENNEDSYDIFPIAYDLGKPPISVLVVADGMGGHEHGEHVSHQAILKLKDVLQKELNESWKKSSLTIDSLKQTLLNGLKSTNELILRMIKANGWKKAGSTIVVAAICGDKVVAANIGDSPLFHYIARERKLVQVSHDHSVVGILLNAKMITEEMARYHERRGQLEFFLGNKTFPSVDPIHEFSLSAGDMLLLCSDGVSGLLTNEEIAYYLAEKTTLQHKANNLIQAARNQGETDNQTLIIWYHQTQNEGLKNESTLRKSPVLPEFPPSPTTSSPRNSLATTIQIEGKTTSIQRPSKAKSHKRKTNSTKQHNSPKSQLNPVTPRNSPDNTEEATTQFYPEEPEETNDFTLAKLFWLLLGITISMSCVIGGGWAFLKFQNGNSGVPKCSTPLSENNQELDEFGLTIECFQEDGKVLITKSTDGSRNAWEFKKQWQEKCESDLVNSPEKISKIYPKNQDKKVPDQLYTREKPTNEASRCIIKLWKLKKGDEGELSSA